MAKEVQFLQGREVAVELEILDASLREKSLFMFFLIMAYEKEFLPSGVPETSLCLEWVRLQGIYKEGNDTANFKFSISPSKRLKIFK